MRFTDILSRADVDVVQQLLGARVVRLLTALDSSLCTPDRLRSIALGLHPPDAMIRNPGFRNAIFDLLRPQEVATLSQVLGTAAHGKDPYQAFAGPIIPQRF